MNNYLKQIIIQILRTKITLNSHRTEETNFELVYEYSPTFNRKNDAMASVDEIDCEHTNNLLVKIIWV